MITNSDTPLCHEVYARGVDPPQLATFPSLGKRAPFLLRDAWVGLRDRRVAAKEIYKQPGQKMPWLSPGALKGALILAERILRCMTLYGLGSLGELPRLQLAKSMGRRDCGLEREASRLRSRAAAFWGSALEAPRARDSRPRLSAQCFEALIAEASAAKGRAKAFASS